MFGFVSTLGINTGLNLGQTCASQAFLLPQALSLLICRIFLSFFPNPRTFLAAPAPVTFLGMSVGSAITGLFPISFLWFLSCFANNLLTQDAGTQSTWVRQEKTALKKEVSGQISAWLSLERHFL